MYRFTVPSYTDGHRSTIPVACKINTSLQLCFNDVNWDSVVGPAWAGLIFGHDDGAKQLSLLTWATTFVMLNRFWVVTWYAPFYLLCTAILLTLFCCSRNPYNPFNNDTSCKWRTSLRESNSEVSLCRSAVVACRIITGIVKMEWCKCNSHSTFHCVCSSQRIRVFSEANGVPRFQQTGRLSYLRLYRHFSTRNPLQSISDCSKIATMPRYRDRGKNKDLVLLAQKTQQQIQPYPPKVQQPYFVFENKG